MKAITLFAFLLIAGQASASEIEQVISVQHDSQRGVTCWILNNTGISCLPDSSLPQEPATTATHESEATRASLANIEDEKGKLPATPLPQDERFQL